MQLECSSFHEHKATRLAFPIWLPLQSFKHEGKRGYWFFASIPFIELRLMASVRVRSRTAIAEAKLANTRFLQLYSGVPTTFIPGFDVMALRTQPRNGRSACRSGL
jgi:hypothetical protein